MVYDPAVSGKYNCESEWHYSPIDFGTFLRQCDGLDLFRFGGESRLCRLVLRALRSCLHVTAATVGVQAFLVLEILIF